MTKILKPSLSFLYHTEERRPVNSGHKFGVPRVVAVHKFDCTTKWALRGYLLLKALDKGVNKS